MDRKFKYLGDGVYIEITDCGNVILMANDHLYPTDKIVLEPNVLNSLINFLTNNQMISNINQQ